TITSPAAGTVVQAGMPVTISGTASETGGSRLAAVEVSTDNGVTWRRASGTSTWSYTWTPTGGGSTVLKSRAVDDNSNVESPAAGVAVTVSTANTLVAAYSFDEGTGATVTDLSGKANNGTISAATWTTSGKYGNALSFNGTNSSVTVPDANSPDLSARFTLAAWVS